MFELFFPTQLITPRARARSKVITRVIVESTKIVISQDVGNESMEFGEKLASVFFKLRDMVHERSAFLLATVATLLTVPMYIYLMKK